MPPKRKSIPPGKLAPPEKDTPPPPPTAAEPADNSPIPAPASLPSSPTHYAFVKLQAGSKIQWPGHVIEEAKWTVEMKKEIEARKTRRKKKDQDFFVKVVKFFEDHEDFVLVTKQADMTPYEDSKKEEVIRKVWAHLQLLKNNEKQLNQFKSDVIAIETALKNRTPSLSSAWFDKITSQKQQSVGGEKKISIVQQLFQKPKELIEEVVTPKMKGGVVVVVTTPKKKQQIKSPGGASVTMATRYKCDVCGTGFERIGALTAHKAARSCVAKEEEVVVKVKKSPGRKRKGVPSKTETGGKRKKVEDKDLKVESILMDWEEDAAVKEDVDDEEDGEEEEKKMPELRLFETVGTSGEMIERAGVTEEGNVRGGGSSGGGGKRQTAVELFDRLNLQINKKEGPNKEEDVVVKGVEKVAKEEVKEEKEKSEEDDEVNDPEDDEEDYFVMKKDDVVAVDTKDDDKSETAESPAAPPSSDPADEEDDDVTPPPLSPLSPPTTTTTTEKQQNVVEPPPVPAPVVQPPPPVSAPEQPPSLLSAKPTATIKPVTQQQQPDLLQETTQQQLPPEQEQEEPCKDQLQLLDSDVTFPGGVIETDQVMHLVPMENADGSITYMLLRLNDNDDGNNEGAVEVSMGTAGQNSGGKDLSTMESLLIDKPVDMGTVLSSIGYTRTTNEAPSSSSSSIASAVATATTASSSPSLQQQATTTASSQVEGLSQGHAAEDFYFVQ